MFHYGVNSKEYDQQLCHHIWSFTTIFSVIYGRYSQHEMSDLSFTFYITKNEFQKIWQTTMLVNLVIHNNFIYDIYGRYSQHEMSASPFTFGAIFYSTKT